MPRHLLDEIDLTVAVDAPGRHGDVPAIGRIAEREAEASLDRARRALERLQRIRERAEQEFAEAARAEKTAEKEVAAAEKSLDKAAAERGRLAKTISG